MDKCPDFNAPSPQFVDLKKVICLEGVNKTLVSDNSYY